MIESLVIMIIVLVASYYDLSDFRIPNWLSVIALMSGLLVSIVTELGIMQSLLGIGVAFIPLYIIYACKGIGAGDVKLLTALGGWLGTVQTIELLVLSFVFGGVISLLFIGWFALQKLYRKRVKQSSIWLKESNSPQALQTFGVMKTHQFPFMLAVLPAIILILFVV